MTHTEVGRPYTCHASNPFSAGPVPHWPPLTELATGHVSENTEEKGTGRKRDPWKDYSLAARYERAWRFTFSILAPQTTESTKISPCRSIFSGLDKTVTQADDSPKTEHGGREQFRPIETNFSGFRFRSRLEARYFVFFQALGIECWYEPEGFRLSSGDLYLPDFYLPKIRTWAEVKPVQMTTPEVLKADDLAHDSGRPVLCLEGPPDFKLYQCIFPDESAMYPVLLDIDYHKRRYYEQEARLWTLPGEPFDKEEHFTPEYRAAVHRSRRERFGVHE